MVNGAPKKVPEGDLQYSPEGLHEYSRDLPGRFIHHDTLKALPQIFIITYLLDQFSGSAVLRMRMPLIAERNGAPSTATAFQPIVAPRLYRIKWCVFTDPPLLECNRNILVQ